VPNLGVVPRGQSEAGFFITNAGATAYREAALVAAGNSSTGHAVMAAEVARRLPTWTATRRGELTPTTPSTMWGGTSFVDDWIDPRIAPANDTPLSGNSDARIAGGRFGQQYFDSLDSLIASHNATTDAWCSIWFRQTWESDDRTDFFTAWPFSVVEYARAITLFVTLEGAKFAATGKPWRIFAVHPGATERGGLNHALMREVVQHLAQNGRTSTRASLAPFGKLPGFYVGGTTINHVTFGAAEQADTGTAGGDFSHQSVGSSQRSGRQLAIELARWLSPGTPQEFNGHPVVHSAFKVPGAPNLIRCRVQITPGNKLVWQGPDPLDTDVNVTGGTTANPTFGHIMAHSTLISSAAIPTLLTVTNVAVNNAPSAQGYAFLDLTLSAPVPATAYVTLGASQNATGYTRRTEAIATTLKKKIGLYEDATPLNDLVVDAAMSDLLRSPVAVAMPVLNVTNLLVAAEDPVTMALQLSVAARNAALDAIETAIGTGPTLEFRTGAQPADCAAADSGTLLGTLTLPSDWLAVASGGVKGQAGSWAGTGGAIGDIGHFRVKQGGACGMQGSCTLSGGGGQLILSSLTTSVGGAISISAWNLTGPNA
jgi:hypothetical protein